MTLKNSAVTVALMAVVVGLLLVPASSSMARLQHTPERLLTTGEVLAVLPSSLLVRLDKDVYRCALHVNRFGPCEAIEYVE